MVIGAKVVVRVIIVEVVIGAVAILEEDINRTMKVALCVETLMVVVDIQDHTQVCIWNDISVEGLQFMIIVQSRLGGGGGYSSGGVRYGYRGARRY